MAVDRVKIASLDRSTTPSKLRARSLLEMIFKWGS